MAKDGLSSYYSLWFNSARMLAEAQIVIGLRLAGMMFPGPKSDSELKRMTSEKLPAFIRAGGDAATAMMLGQSPDRIAAAALKPIAQRTRSNVRRLSKPTKRR